MKYIKQWSVILLMSFLGEILYQLLPFTIPASIYGFLLLLLALCTGLCKVEHVKETSVFLIEAMPLMFIPAIVGLIPVWNSVKSMLVPLTVSIVVITIFVFGVTGCVAQWVIRRKEGKQE